MNIEATLSILDEDQGVCYLDHQCSLLRQYDSYFRACDTRHDDLDGKPYVGMPLIRWDATKADIDAAEATGVDEGLIVWARSYLDDREAT